MPNKTPVPKNVNGEIGKVNKFVLDCSQCPIRPFTGRNFIGKPVFAHKDFLPVLEKIDKAAGEAGVKVYVTSSLRPSGKPVKGSIVTPAQKSNHHVGHAIDANIQYIDEDNKRQMCGSKNDCLGTDDLPDSVADFIERVKQSGVRYGGDFKTPDVVHFDDGLNVKAPQQWQEQYDLIQKYCRKTDDAQTCSEQGVVCAYKSVTDVIAFIHQEMVTNQASPAVKMISKETVMAFYHWYELVAPGKVWDHKRTIIAKFGKFTCDYERKTRYDYDVWSNIHYGYVGRAANFQEDTLLAGAGGAQLMKGTSNVPDGYLKRSWNNNALFSSLDDSRDQAAIEIGFTLWKEQGPKVTTTQILEAVRAASGSLGAVPCDKHQK